MERITLDGFVSELTALISKGVALLEHVGFNEDCLEIYGLVEADIADPNTEYRLKAVDEIAYSIYTASETLAFLKRRESKPVHILQPVPGERYGYIDEWGLIHEFHCGHCFEALLSDDEGREHWVPVSIEHSDGGYYLVRHSDVALEGLVIRDGR